MQYLVEELVYHHGVEFLQHQMELKKLIAKKIFHTALYISHRLVSGTKILEIQRQVIS
jgi:hypothetical protein